METTKRQDFIDDIKDTLQDIVNWVEVKTCRCSHYPTRTIVQAAMNWELGEEFRIIKNINSDVNSNINNLINDLIEELADSIINKWK